MRNRARQMKTSGVRLGGLYVMDGGVTAAVQSGASSQREGGVV